LSNNAPVRANAVRHRTFKLTDARKDKLFLIAILAPAFAMLTFTIGIPIVKSLYMSLFDFTLLKMKSYSWNNFDNYRNIFADKEFYTAVGTTFKYVILVVSAQFVLGMALALALNTNLRFRKVIRTAILIPWIVPTIVASLLWMWLFQPQYGVINYILQQLHLIDKPYEWLANLNLALPAVIVAALWRQLPFMSTMLLAGMQGISADMYEAAKIDGASSRQIFTSITLPLLKNTIKTVTLISIIENFKMFPLFWIMTGGGPLNATTTLAILSYKTAFIQLDLGKGAAIGAVWLVMLLIFSWGYSKLFSLGEES
jgi:multiple sugar transport system permease protein